MKKRKIFIFIVPIITILCIGAILTISLINKNSTKNTNIAFVNVSPIISEAIKSQIKQPQDSEIIFHSIEFSEVSNKDQLKQYDLIISWEGSFTKSIEQFAEKIPSKILSKIPFSLSSKTNKSLPLLLDHYELLYYNNTAVKEIKTYPSTFDDFESYLYNMLDYVFIPFFTYGGDDTNLLAFISALIEAKGGYSSYTNFASILNSDYSFEELINTSIGTGSSNALCLKDILDILKKWQKDGILHPLWFNAKFGDFEYFMNLKQIAVGFTSLSNHRKLEYNLVKNFTSTEFPKVLDKNYHGIIAPTLLAIQMKENTFTDQIISTLISDITQENLSSATTLAPTNSASVPFDIQADDVRFWTAACKYGTIADLGSLVYQTDAEKASQFCKKIREYLSY